MLLFVDLDSTGEPGEAGREGASARLRTLLEGLGPYAELVEVVVSSPWARAHRLEDLWAAHGLDLPTQVVGNLWDDVPPLSLSRYEHIIYWLTRRHVWRLPSWLAVLPSEEEWPADQHRRLIQWSDSRDAAATSHALRAQLERYYWADLWWGDGPPPDAAARWRAHALMVAWSLPRRRWPHVLGHTTPEFEVRLDLLLKVHAGAQRYVRAGVWYPHWVHLPRAELGRRRPIELIEASGVQGIEQVLAYVWQPEPATVSLPQGVASAGLVRPSNY
ncbi:hypothetical protein [Aerolutibacter ruishenii]|uniref:Uncharacterized protein n=1 Tax=Aerolutibacter ruishenii TaxID=686800 RepID=A0A562LV41_9GAMM|nr:hypothetical protein [Lysobacter ruishenii]TWI06387.1 hypothetical protein IP93_03007 [Lysobacter ruishenii]TWI11485.1 hypothetical protein IP93_01381 [Lysobacter ruishenii]